jgi:hypothetical protein
VNAWDRQENEGEAAWAAFLHYRDMLIPRKLFANKGMHAMAQIQEWSNQHTWEDRCKAYDRYLDSARVAERVAVLKVDENERNARTLMACHEAKQIASLELEKLLDAAKSSDAHGFLKPADIVKIFECAVKCERLVKGEATEIVETKGPTVDYSKLSDEDLEALANAETVVEDMRKKCL